MDVLITFPNSLPVPRVRKLGLRDQILLVASGWATSDHTHLKSFCAAEGEDETDGVVLAFRTIMEPDPTGPGKLRDKGVGKISGQPCKRWFSYHVIDESKATKSHKFRIQGYKGGTPSDPASQPFSFMKKGRFISVVYPPSGSATSPTPISAGDFVAYGSLTGGLGIIQLNPPPSPTAMPIFPLFTSADGVDQQCWYAEFPTLPPGAGYDLQAADAEGHQADSSNLQAG